MPRNRSRHGGRGDAEHALCDPLDEDEGGAAGEGGVGAAAQGGVQGAHHVRREQQEVRHRLVQVRNARMLILQCDRGGRKPGLG